MSAIGRGWPPTPGAAGRHRAGADMRHARHAGRRRADPDREEGRAMPMQRRTRAATDAVYQYIRDYHDEHGISPTVREIRDALGLSSTSVVAARIRRLVDDGRLVRVHDRPAARGVIPAG